MQEAKRCEMMAELSPVETIELSPLLLPTENGSFSSRALCRLHYPLVQQEEERAGRGGCLPSRAVNLHTQGLKGPSVNDL